MLLAAGVLWMGLTSVAGVDTDEDSAADVITLRDGTVLLGQVVGGAAFQGVTVFIRREWARAAAPDWLERWERREAPRLVRGRRERKARLADWRRERQAGDGGSDPVVAGIDREVAALSAPRPPGSVLTEATLERSEVRVVTRKSADAAGLLRRAWLAGLGDAEARSPAGLRAALASIGRLGDPSDPARVDALLPLYPEPDDRWRLRRAATEVAVEPALRVVRFGALTLPAAGEAAAAGGGPAEATTSGLIDSPAGRGAFAAIQAVSPFDAVAARLDAIAARGRIGAVVSRVSLGAGADDPEGAAAESTFLVRQAGGRWATVFTREASPAGADPGADPETLSLQTTLRVLESVAPAPPSPEESRLRMRAGAAGGRALRNALAALADDVMPFVLPVVASPR